MNTMKLLLPESHKDISLEQYLKYTELKKRKMPKRQFNRRVLMIFTDLKYKETEKIEIGDYVGLLELIDKAMTTDHPFENTFTMDGVEFGFLPNLDEMQAKEFFDLKMYKDEDENLHKIMAVLFRPIKHRDKLGNYQIDDYRGTNLYAEWMKKAPMSIVFGALFFFRNLRTELSLHILQYIEVEQAKGEGQKSSLTVGGGIRQFMSWLKGKRGSLKQSKT